MFTKCSCDACNLHQKTCEGDEWFLNAFPPLCHFFPGVGDRKGVRIQKALCIRSSRADGDDDCNLYTTLHHIWSAVYAVQDCQLLKIHTNHGKILYAFLYEKRVATML